MIDAETMAGVLYDFATYPEMRDAVKTEFSRIQALFGEYQSTLRSAALTRALGDWGDADHDNRSRIWATWGWHREAKG